MKRRPLPYGFHYNIPAAFDPSVSYDMQYQRLREIVYSIIDNMEIHIPYMIFTTEAHTNDVVTLTGSFYTDHKEVLANKTFSLKGLPDGTYYININAKYKFEPCEPDCSCVKAISPDSDMTLETVYMPDGGITLYTVVRKNGEITAVNYNDIYTGMHNIAPDAHENRFSDVYAKIKAEVDRATAAEETLQRNIDNETARAMDAENVLDEKIKAEQTRATAAEHTLQDNINKEQARAEQAESTLQANITAEANRAKAAENGLQKNIDAEAKSRADADTAERTRALAAEDVLKGNIDTEVTNRTAADTAERTRAITAEDKLQKNIDNEVANRTAAVTAERERAVNSENKLTEDITTESTDRQRADTALDTKLTGLINAEETRATQAERNLQTAINTEETARINADSKEINDRTAADTALGKRIDAEITNRTSAIANEANSRTTADTAERERATAAEENLQTQIAALAELGPGLKQDVFATVEGDGGVGEYISLKGYKYWDSENNQLVGNDQTLLKLTNIYEGKSDFDAVNKRQLDTKQNKINSNTTLSMNILNANNVDIAKSLIISSSALEGENLKLYGTTIDGKRTLVVNYRSLTMTPANQNAVITGIADGSNDNDAANIKQLNNKQDKITNTTELTAKSVSANTVTSVGDTRVYGDIVCVGSVGNARIHAVPGADYITIKSNSSIHETKDNPMRIVGVKDGLKDNDAVNFKQLNATNTRVTAVENKISTDEIAIPTNNIKVENETINQSTLYARRICGNIYAISGNVGFQKTTAVPGNTSYTLNITVPNKQIKNCLSCITGSIPAGSEYRNVDTTVGFSNIVEGGIESAVITTTDATGPIVFGVSAIVEFKE